MEEKDYSVQEIPLKYQEEYLSPLSRDLIKLAHLLDEDDILYTRCGNCLFGIHSLVEVDNCSCSYGVDESDPWKHYPRQTLEDEPGYSVCMGCTLFLCDDCILENPDGTFRIRRVETLEDIPKKVIVEEIKDDMIDVQSQINSVREIADELEKKGYNVQYLLDIVNEIISSNI